MSSQKKLHIKIDDEGYYQDARDWELSRIGALERSETRAWRVAAVASIATLASVIAVAMLTPLKSAVPFVIYVDKLSGDTQVHVAMGAESVAFSEILDKHWVSEYVLSRERYYWNLLQYDYDHTSAFSAEVAGVEYEKQFDGPEALQTMMGRSNEYAVKIISVTIPAHKVGKEGTAVVRFEKILRNIDNGQPGTPSRYIATLSYIYKSRQFIKEKTVMMNPLGFTVTAYRVDPEVAELTPSKPSPIAPPMSMSQHNPVIPPGAIVSTGGGGT